MQRTYPEFFIDRFISGHAKASGGTDAGISKFCEVCERVKAYIDTFFRNISESNEMTQFADLQKKAIIGERDAVKKITAKIVDALTVLNLLAADYPNYYRNLPDAVFSELYGLSILAPWANDYTEEYRKSSSAKIIGDKLYCLINGKSELQPRRISRDRRAQLRHALLLAYPKERADLGHNEVYLNREDGGHIRATLLGGDYTPESLDVMVFRKYLISDPDELSFEALASKGTFPKECCELFRNLVAIGPNIFFCGEVRSGKSTFLQVWQHYEDPSLEGTTVSSDEETDYAKITNGPLVQIIADEQKLEQVEKSLKRLDSNYIILSEVRGAAEYRFFLGITNMGTRRCKCTIHDNNAINFPYKMATEIITCYGGNQEATISQLYSNIDFVFELQEVPSERSKKRLMGIVELRYDPVSDLCSAHRICKYDPKTDSWKWKADIGENIRSLASGYPGAYEKIRSLLAAFEMKNPLEGETVVFPAYYAGNQKRKEKSND